MKFNDKGKRSSTVFLSEKIKETEPVNVESKNNEIELISVSF